MLKVRVLIVSQPLAGSILLSHALLNENQSLSDQLITRGVKITFEHVTIAMLSE